MDELGILRLWGRRIANHRLTSGMLPPPRASDAMLLQFAHTFDGYMVRPTDDMQVWVPGLLEAHKRGERSEHSLTMARAALFGFSRWDYFGGGWGSLEPAFAGCMQALVERIRELLVAREAGRRPAPGSLMEIEDGLMDAYERFLEGYAMWGGYRFHGWTDFPDTRNFQGPVIWSEGDGALRFAFELERQFPRSVHTEFAIGKATRVDYDKDVERRQRVDLVVSDLSAFEEDETSQERFRTMQHGAFIEAKWLVKGWRGHRFEQDATKRVASVYDDINKLARHLSLGRCRVAAVLVVDDEDYFAIEPPAEPQPADNRVWRLIAGPRALEDRGLLQREWPTHEHDPRPSVRVLQIDDAGRATVAAVTTEQNVEAVCSRNEAAEWRPMYTLTMDESVKERSALPDDYQLPRDAAAALERLDNNLGDHLVVDEFSP